MNDDGNVCDFEHSVYFSLKKIWRIDNKDVPAYKGKSLYHNELIKNSECPNYASNLELQNDPTIYQSSMNIQKPVVGEGYPRKMAFNNLHYDSTRQMTVLNVETNSYDQLIFYPSK
uniref:Uncharacterized protein n=1 Tax=Steinernema glaseri TaxID=37863 RepID=A0A1I8AUQ2_9BILA